MTTSTPTSKITSIELVSPLGTFTFAEHFNSEADAYQAMTLFEGNNWKMLGEYHYVVNFAWSDETTTSDTIKGINASAELACYFDEDHANEMNALYASQH